MKVLTAPSRVNPFVPPFLLLRLLLLSTVWRRLQATRDPRPCDIAAVERRFAALIAG